MPTFRVKSVKIYTSQKKICTDAVRGVRDKYQVCTLPKNMLKVSAICGLNETLMPKIMKSSNLAPKCQGNSRGQNSNGMGIFFKTL